MGAADLDILSRSHFFDNLSRECATRGASVVYATHIFDQADSWASHVALMQLDRVLSPLYDLQSLPSYQKVLARQGHSRAMCPMYVLVMEELERQYRASGLFVEDYHNDNEKNQGKAGTNSNFVDAIMSEQAKELADERFDTERTKNQDNWVSGRLTRQLQKAEQEVLRAKRTADRIE